MDKNDVKTKCKYKRWISFFRGSWKYERYGSRGKLTWRTYFARDLLRSYFHEPQKNEIYFLNVQNRFSHDMVLAIIMLMLLCYVVIKSAVTI